MDSVLKLIERLCFAMNQHESPPKQAVCLNTEDRIINLSNQITRIGQLADCFSRATRLNEHLPLGQPGPGDFGAIAETRFERNDIIKPVHCFVPTAQLQVEP